MPFPAKNILTHTPIRNCNKRLQVLIADLLAHRISRVANIHHTTMLVFVVKVGVPVAQPAERKWKNLASHLPFRINPKDVYTVQSDSTDIILHTTTLPPSPQRSL
jgi:hypothetical protein